jgi:hypothetical protein
MPKALIVCWQSVSERYRVVHKNDHFGNIRAFRTRSFSLEELFNLCFDTPELTEVYDKRGANTSIDEFARLMVEFADKKGWIETLLQAAKERNPNKYEEYKADFQLVRARGSHLNGLGLGGSSHSVPISPFDCILASMLNVPASGGEESYLFVCTVHFLTDVNRVLDMSMSASISGVIRA